MFEGKDPEVKVTMLRDTCDKTEKFSYEKAFTNKDVTMFQERLSDIMIEVSRIEEELRKVKKEFTDKMKPLKIEIKELIENINFRSRMVEEQVYIFINHDKNQVGYYNEEGNLIHKRMLKIDEHQRSIMGEVRRNNGSHEEEYEEEYDDAEYEDA